MAVTLPQRQANRVAIVILLTIAMVFAHWQGLSHRVAHAWQSRAAAEVDVAAPSGSHQKAYTHSCLAYDAATVAPALHSPGCTTGLLPGGRVLAQWAAFASWDAPFTPYFSSRAPPVA